MKLAVEDNKNSIGFFEIDGRQLKKFIKRAITDIEGLTLIWRYSHKKRLRDSSVSSFEGVNVVYKKTL